MQSFPNHKLNFTICIYTMLSPEQMWEAFQVHTEKLRSYMMPSTEVRPWSYTSMIRNVSEPSVRREEEAPNGRIKICSFQRYTFPVGPINTIFIRGDGSEEGEQVIIVISAPESSLLNFSTKRVDEYKILLTIDTEHGRSNILFANCNINLLRNLYDELFYDSGRGENICASLVFEESTNVKFNLKKLHIEMKENKFQLFKDRLMHIIPCNMWMC
jgi:hypothetical protein